MLFRSSSCCSVDTMAPLPSMATGSGTGWARPALRDRPLLTTMFDSLEDFTPVADSAYVFATTAEFRSAHSPEWESRAAGATFIRVLDQSVDRIRVEVRGEPRDIPLRSRRSIDGFWGSLSCSRVYLDITGLSHHVWAPLLQSALSTVSRVMVVYVEPKDYAFSPTPTEGAIFDLSERVEGIRPLPGFTVLRDVDDARSCFVPLLGFEGTRFAFLLEHTQPAADRIVPIIGVPGFRPEFPFHAYWGNKSVLYGTPGRRRIRYAIANDPFSLYYTLEDIGGEYSDCSLKIAPIGTKPHSLGAILFAIARPDAVEIVYDHPVRKVNRTRGRAAALVYDVSAFRPPST